MTEIPAPAATAARAIAGAVLRHALTIAGTALVARGYVDQETAHNAVPPIADYLVGAAMATASASWAGLRAWFAHTRFAAAWAALNGDDVPSPDPERKDP